MEPVEELKIAFDEVGEAVYKTCRNLLNCSELNCIVLNMNMFFGVKEVLIVRCMFVSDPVLNYLKIKITVLKTDGEVISSFIFNPNDNADSFASFWEDTWLVFNSFA